MKKYIVSGLIGLGIAAGCLLPPIIHFVTGPLGPFIGGFAGGVKARAKWNGAVIIGLTIGIGLTVFLLAVGSLIMSLNISLPGMKQMADFDFFSSASSIITIALIPFCVGTVLGTLGAFVGGKVINKEMEGGEQKKN